ncbi:MAG: dTMP kinase, partial [Candidatus Rokubacteria bacterium]|nr:dTMP kinase [Candidatus Rokubacteria bacterium]
MAGLLITVEGVEGSGKTTHCRLLADWLRAQGYRVSETSEPDGSPIGAAVRAIFEQDGLTPLTETLLFMAARQQHVAQVIRPALEGGEIVISDRYADATLAYQGYGRGLDLQTIRELNALATGGVVADLTLL